MEQAIIQTKNLTKKYGSKTAVNSLNLQIRQGEIFGLLGPNGAGKTTTILMLLGLTEPTSGNAAILGLNCTREAVKIKRAVGYLPDNVGFYPDMTGRQNLLFTGKLNGLCSNEAETRAEALLARVGMTDAADQRTRTYSKGMKLAGTVHFLFRHLQAFCNLGAVRDRSVALFCHLHEPDREYHRQCSLSH